MDRKASRIHPSRLRGRKKFEAFSRAPLHLHHMGKHMNGAWMRWLEGQRTTCYLFSAAVLAVLFEAESVHRKNACVAGDGVPPCRHHLGNAVSQHAPLAEPEVERVRNCEGENIARPVDQDCA